MWGFKKKQKTEKKPSEITTPPTPWEWSVAKTVPRWRGSPTTCKSRYCPCYVQTPRLFTWRSPHSPGTGSYVKQRRGGAVSLWISLLAVPCPGGQEKPHQRPVTGAPGLKTEAPRRINLWSKTAQTLLLSLHLSAFPPHPALRGIERNLPNSVSKRGWAGEERQR